MKNYVIINGVNSNTITGLMINELPPITKPQMRVIQEEIDGRDGDITTNLGYSAYDKTITIGLFGTGYDINNIISFFNGEGTIVFSNEDDKYYNFKILNQIDYVSLQKFKSASITFHCQPFKYPLTETPLEIEYSYVSDEGETISLNTASGTMKVNLLGNTSQTGTPTPDNPIPVNVVSGDNDVVVCGKNIFDGEIEQNAWNNGNGTGTVWSNQYLRTKDYIKCDTNTQYTISFILKGDNLKRGNILSYDENKTFLQSIILDTNLTFTTSNNTKYLKFNFYASNNIIPSDLTNIQLEKGNQSSQYEPYQSTSYPIHLGTYELCKIGTYQDKFIRNSGKNLWDEEMEYGGYNLTTGAKENTNNYRSVNYIPVKPNTNYSLYKPTGMYTRILFYDSSKTFISAPDVIYTNRVISSFTSPNNAYYMTFYIDYGSATYNNNIMLVEGTYTSETIPPYEPYGNGDWYLEKEFGEKVFTGASNEPWQDRPNYSPADRFVMDGVFPTNNRSMISNYFKINQITDDTYPYLTNNGTQCTINFSAKGTTTLAQFKTWLSTNNTKVIYPLATPTYTKIEGTLKDELDAVWRAYSFEGTTNISQVNNDKAFILNVVAMEEGSNEVQVNNIGNTYAKPLIALEGTGNINIYLDNTQILQANVEDKMNIDIAKLEAYNPDTSVLLNRQVIGNYNSMTIPSGTSIVRMDGELTKATITNYTRWL